MRFKTDESKTIYCASLGPVFERRPFSFSGLCLEGSLGYLMETDVGFYFLPNLKTGGIIRNKEKSGWIIGIDLTIGWFIKS